MAEYIEKEKASLILREEAAANYPTAFHVGLYAAARAIESFPAADVRPVVLCRDCKYYYKDADGYEMCENSEGYDHVREDGFCAWAKKREES